MEWRSFENAMQGSLITTWVWPRSSLAWPMWVWPAWPCHIRQSWRFTKNSQYLETPLLVLYGIWMLRGGAAANINCMHTLLHHTYRAGRERLKANSNVWKVVLSNTRYINAVAQLRGILFSQSDIRKKLSHHFLLPFWIDIGSYDQHAKYQGVSGNTPWYFAWWS